MNEELFDTECYQDFTTASDWEIFIARIEEIINHWRTDELREETPTKPSRNSPWELKTENLAFIDVPFELRHYRKAVDLSIDDNTSKKTVYNLDIGYDFELRDESKVTLDSCLSSWCGLNEYIVLRPVNMDITNESKIRILISSINVVMSNLNLEVPIFVQVRENWQRLYFGVFEHNGVRTNFEMIHLQNGPQHCQYLSGLLEVFKSKIMPPYPLDNIVISMQATYVLNDFGKYVWKQELDYIHKEHQYAFILPFGISVDPINKLILKAWWRNFSDRSIIDNENFSSFDPQDAHMWTCFCESTINPVCYLNDCLSELGQIFSNKLSIAEIMAEFIDVSPQANPLELLTAPAVPTLSTLLKKAGKNSGTGSKKIFLPIPEHVLVLLLYFLFPDADGDSNFPRYNKNNDQMDDKKESAKEFSKDREDLFKFFKTCPPDSLVWRLVIVLSYGLHSLGGIKAFAHIWYEFVGELKFRWERHITIPGIGSGFPDLKTCLLNQKLQMLNSCIERKKNRQEAQVKYYSNVQNSDDSENSDNEFYDCSENVDQPPVGRLSKFGDLKLLKTGESLYIPVTQEPVLKTEDQLEEDTDVLLKLGSDQESSELRARIMSASLLSDMESFKAANPGCIMEDFIRWYSPRDWIEEESLDDFGQKKGHLSDRMTVKDNIWVQMWESARSIPANRQKRLFDDTKEAEKILQYFEFITASQIGELIYPVIVHASLYRVIDELESIPWEIPLEKNRMQSLIKKGEDLTRDLKFRMSKFDNFAEDVMEIELLVSRVKSLVHKLQQNGSKEDIFEAVGNLISEKEIVLEDSNEQSNLKSRLISLLLSSHNVGVGDRARKDSKANFPVAYQREFVMRTVVARPLASSAKCPQFLRAIVSRNEFRLVGAFSEDTVFF